MSAITISLNDSQLEIVIRAAELLAEEKCQEFLENVAAVLRVHGEINDDDVSAAVKVALRGLLHNSAVWKEWSRNSLPPHQDGQGFDVHLTRPPAALTSWRPWHLLPTWSKKLRKWATQVFVASPPYSEATEIPVDTKNGHFDRKLIAAE